MPFGFSTAQVLGQRLTDLPDGDLPQPLPIAAAELPRSAYESISFESHQRLIAAEVLTCIRYSVYDATA